MQLAQNGSNAPPTRAALHWLGGDCASAGRKAVEVGFVEMEFGLVLDGERGNMGRGLPRLPCLRSGRHQNGRAVSGPEGMRRWGQPRLSMKAQDLRCRGVGPKAARASLWRGQG